jgi:predicted ATPase/class 3 adenylate cyclase
MPMPRAAGSKDKLSGPASFPTGTVTFLFTDIEGSTKRWEANPEAMDAALKQHDAVLRAVIERHGGYVFKTVGDAFCAAFSRASDALESAVEAQRALSGQDSSAIGGLRVRMGLHAGEVSQRDGDYFGPTLNRVARLMSIGHGGQVLLSDAVRLAVGPATPPEVTLVDLGLRRLKDLTQPEHVWQLDVAGLPAQFPPLNSLDARPNNLSFQLTNLVGRESDLEEVKSLLAHHRLVTLVGSGGVGKTRVAIQVGADLIDRYPDGVWFADLAPISGPELVPSVVAKVLGISVPEGRSVDDSIPLWLRGKNALIIFDNCEHVLGAAAELGDAILKSAPKVCILATSRQTLGIPGEAVYNVPSLAVPTETVGLKADEALRFGAVALFRDRAVASDTRFVLTDEGAPIAADICRRLDGIPLAIELAAARVKVLGIANLARRLDERFKILTGGSRIALPRQKTLTALIDWSYDLLSEQEQKLFRRLGIFAGGFGLDAATAICAGEGVGEPEVLELVASLVDKSLVVADTSREPERFSLLESTRAYALEKLASLRERDALARRHAGYFARLALTADQASGNLPVAAVLASLEPEVDNFRAVLEWALKDAHDVAVGGSLAGALEQLWYEGGLSAEGRWWIGSALEREHEPAIAGRMWVALALLSSGRQKFECGERARTLYESVGDERGAAHASRSMARGLIQMGRLEEAAVAATRALAVFREHGDKQGEALCLNELADISGDRGDVSAARELYAQTLAAFRGLGDEAGHAVVLIDLAELDFRAGDPERAIRNAREAIEIDSRGKNATNLAIEYSNSAAYLIALGDLDAARESAADGLRWANKAQSASKVAWILQHFALIAGLRAQLHAAARLLGYVDSQYKDLGLERESTERWGHEKLIALLRERLSDAEIDRLSSAGAMWSENTALEEALKV